VSEFAFPVARFKSADATSEEVAFLVDEFDRSDISIQRAISEHFTSVADGDLRDYLDARRANGDFAVADAPKAKASKTLTPDDTEESGDATEDDKHVSAPAE
jgi:hypothetical protein